MKCGLRFRHIQRFSIGARTAGGTDADYLSIPTRWTETRRHQSVRQPASHSVTHHPQVLVRFTSKFPSLSPLTQSGTKSQEL